MVERQETGVVSLASPHGMETTVRLLVDALTAHGMTIFACIDQQRASEEVGLTMAAMVLILFGDPKTGTPLMRKYPSLAIDLPLKALVWVDDSGHVRVSYNSPDYLRRRHGIGEAVFTGVAVLLAGALQTDPNGGLPPPCSA